MQAEMRLVQSTARIPELQRLRGVAHHASEVLTGAQPDSSDIPVQPLRSVLVRPTIPVGLPTDLLIRQPDILQAEESLIAAHARIGAARAYFFRLRSRAQTSEFTNWLDWQSRSVTIGPSVTPPIFEGKTNIARLEVAEARYEQWLEYYWQTLLQVIQEVADLLVTMRMRSTIEELRHQVELAVKAAPLARIRFENGLTAQRLVEVEELCVAEMVQLFIALAGCGKTLFAP